MSLNSLMKLSHIDRYERSHRSIRAFTSVGVSVRIGRSRADALLNLLINKIDFDKLSNKDYLRILFFTFVLYIQVKNSNGNHLNTPYNKGSPS